MEGLKKLIFNYIDKNNITNEDLKKLLFAIAKDTAKTKAINYLCWLYLKTETNTFKDILEDTLQQAVVEFYTDKELAYKNTMAYIYKTYTSQIRKNTITSIDNVNINCGLNGSNQKHYIKTYTIRQDTKEQAEYYNHLIDIYYKNSERGKGVFKDKTQKQQVINKLQKLQMIEA